VRPAAIYGPREMRFLKLAKALKSGTFVMFGSGEVRYHFIHVEDLCDALCLCAELDEAVGEVFIIAGREPVTLRKMVESIAREVGVHRPWIHFPYPLVLGLAYAVEWLCGKIRVQPPLFPRRVRFFMATRHFDTRKAKDLLKDLYKGLTPWRKCQVARHPERPHCKDYIDALFTDFTPLAGDRSFADDHAIQVGMARFELKQQADRLSRLADQYASGQAGVPQLKTAVGDLPTDPPADQRSTAELVERLIDLHAMKARYADNPVQREPVEHARAEVEAVLRARGDASIDAIAMAFPGTTDTRAQTRLLTHVIGQLSSDAADEFALGVFEDSQFASGVRLVAARIAMRQFEDRVIERLLELMITNDPTFLHREQIASFFGQYPDPRAAAVFADLVTDQSVDASVRRFALQAMGHYDSTEIIEALKEVAALSSAGDMRAQALHSLHEILGVEILEFLRFLRPTLHENDNLLVLIDNIEEHYAAR